MGFRAVFAEAGWSRGRCSISLCIRTGARRMPACIGCALILHSCLYCGHCPIVIMHVFQKTQLSSGALVKADFCSKLPLMFSNRQLCTHKHSSVWICTVAQAYAYILTPMHRHACTRMHPHNHKTRTHARKHARSHVRICLLTQAHCRTLTYACSRMHAHERMHTHSCEYSRSPRTTWLKPKPSPIR